MSCIQARQVAELEDMRRNVEDTTRLLEVSDHTSYIVIHFSNYLLRREREVVMSYGLKSRPKMITW